MKQHHNIISKVKIALYVLGRVLYHKSTYGGRLSFLLPDLKKDGYLYLPSTRNKIIGYLLGIDAWHQILFGKTSNDGNLCFLLACVCVLYDNTIDEEQVRDWDRFERLIISPSDVKQDGGRSDEFYDYETVAAIRKVLIKIKELDPKFWEISQKYFMQVHRATKENFMQATKREKDIEKLRESSYEKGGSAFILWTLVADKNIDSAYYDLSYNFGAAVQMADDIFDRREDTGLGQCTIASCNRVQEKDRELISNAIYSLPTPHGVIPKTLFEALKIHLLGSLRYYDSGKLSGRWKYSIARSLFGIASKMMPYISLSTDRPSSGI